jgi:hypothetical protein
MEMAALLTKEDLKFELGIGDTENDELLELLAAGVVSLFERLTGRTIEQSEFAEFYDIDEYSSTVCLKQRPVSSVSAIYDDPDWNFDETTRVSVSDYTVNKASGIIYNQGYWSRGRQSLKVAYRAGYATLPAGWKRIFCQQGAHWFRLSKDARWDMSSIAMPEGAGTMSFKNVEQGLLPQFVLLVQLESR